MDIQYPLELIGTFMFAISGALAVQDREHDLFGAGFTGFITAIGGGSLRDIILGSYPLVWVGDVWFLYAIFLGILTAFLFHRSLGKLRRTLFLFDTFGIGFFTILGVEKALSLGVQVEIAAIMGMFSAVMGGVIRDTLTNEVPILFRREVYASACLAGAIIYLVLNHFGLDRDPNMLISIGIVIIIRLVAVKYKLSLPRLE
ncbi:trimeric intracellular cation channel family protein [Litoribacter ruber]|uniref:Trimeric intracellular cation channel family protein n=1 Tax=Litoribacter ruber TaxID=702568 RepID=A0AAP2CIT0_9BACT|nr:MULTISPECIES: trimeric intracellular cation channel family protein [Litoribacter]MBS9523350.1 trimeric intracellular cation channel family protein [Litoribacter alkaliphilus]MBT0812524.1 trimeric intracellular cation channel family protein [Litoribacter ruber]